MTEKYLFERGFNSFDKNWCKDTYFGGNEEIFGQNRLFLIFIGILRYSNLMIKIMGLTKTSLYTDQQNELAVLAKVLGHPARIAILEQLTEAKTCICGDLVAEIGLSQPTISQHLKELKQAGLIKGTVAGTKMCYCLDVDRWKIIREQFFSFFKKISSANNCC